MIGGSGGSCPGCTDAGAEGNEKASSAKVDAAGDEGRAAVRLRRLTGTDGAEELDEDEEELDEVEDDRLDESEDEERRR